MKTVDNGCDRYEAIERNSLTDLLISSTVRIFEFTLFSLIIAEVFNIHTSDVQYVHEKKKQK